MFFARGVAQRAELSFRRTHGFLRPGILIQVIKFRQAPGGWLCCALLADCACECSFVVQGPVVRRVHQVPPFARPAGSGEFFGAC